jgi:S-adenosylmethionine hydrolase
VFGNLTTDLPAKAITNAKQVTFKLRGHIIHGLVTSYGHRETGDLIALVDSENYIEISIVNGDAASQIEAQIGDTVEVIINA